MGDRRYEAALHRISQASDRAQAMQGLSDDEVVQALAAASSARDPYLANVLATEAMNRMRRSRSITEHLAEGAFSVDESLRFTFVNPALAARLGRPWQECVGRELPQLLHLYDLSGTLLTGTPRCPVERALREKADARFDGYFAAPGAPRAPVSVIVSPVLREGVAVGAVGAFRDLTEAQRTERVLDAERRRMYAVLESVEEGIVLLDASGRHEHANGRALDMLRVAREELEDVRALARLFDLDGGFVPPERWPGSQLLQTGRHEGRRALVERRDGTRIVVDVQAFPLRDAGGTLLGAVVGFRDATRELEREGRDHTLAALVRDSQDAILHATPDGAILDWNEGAQRLFGFTRQEALGRKVDLLAPPGMTDGHLSILRRVAAGEPVPPKETLCLRKDGSLVDVSLLVSPVRDRDGRVTTLSAAYRDATALRAAREELSRSEARLERLHALTRLLVAARSKEEVARAVLEAGLDALGGVAAAVVVREGDTLRILDARGYPEAITAPVRSFPVDADLPLARAVRERRLMMHADAATLLRDHPSLAAALEGKDRAAVCIPLAVGEEAIGGIGVTFAGPRAFTREDEAFFRTLGAHAALALDRALADEGRERSEAQYRDLVENSPEPMAVHADGRLLFINRSGARLIGAQEPSALVGRSVLDFVHPESRPLVMARIRELLAAGAPLPPAEESFVRLDGTRVHVETVAMPITYEGRRAVQLIIRDITHRKEAEAQARRFQAELEDRVHVRTRELQEALRDMQTFANSASHDLRAPLRGVGAFLDDLEQALLEGDAEEARQLVGRARRENARASRLVQDLLAFAKSGRKELHLSRVDVSALAEEVAREISERHPEYRAEWRVEPGLWAQADAALLKIALDNLMGNAAKYAQRQPAPRVEMHATRDGDTTVFHVRDNGVGFAQAEAYRLFEPFARMTTSAGFEGTGLGLSTAHRIVTRHGGRIWAVGEPGKGATFSFTLAEGSPR